MRHKNKGLRSTVSILLALGLIAGALIVTPPPRSASAHAVALPSRPEAQDPALDLPPTLTYLPLVMVNYRSARSVFGVQMNAVTDAQGLQQALQAQIAWVRARPFAWNRIEPLRQDPPSYNWSAVDEVSILNAAQTGLTYIGLVHFTPSWAQALPGHACGPIRQDKLDAFAEYLQALVARYRQAPYNVHYWELWNEPDVDPSLVSPTSGYGCWGDENDPYYGGGYYAEMLKVAYPAIKAADPHAQVFLGGLLLDSPSKSSSKFLEGILLNGGGPYFDALAFHVYTYGTSNLGEMTNANWPGSITAIPEKVAFLRGVLDQYGFGQKPLISTEAAMLCSQPWPECLETQAMYLPRAYAEALALSLGQQTYYTMVQSSWYECGLLSPDLTPRPVYRAYQAATSFLADVRYAGPAAGYPVGIGGYAFDPKARLGFVDLIWSVDGSVVDVPLPQAAEAYDRYGALIGSSGTIQVDYSPVYVLRP